MSDKQSLNMQRQVTILMVELTGTFETTAIADTKSVRRRTKYQPAWNCLEEKK